jgi:photosystem II stability/assembly factor-like uncharacterized protein
VLIGNLTVAQTLRITRQLSNIPSSIRGLSAVSDKVIWFSGSKGYVGLSTDGGISWTYGQVKEFETMDFRSLYAFDSKKALIANAGSPAHILKTVDGGKTWNPVYHNGHAEIFLDGMDFWDDKTGLIYGDPIGGRMMILKTNNGGNSWNEIEIDQRPALRKGEASFAASGTGIRCVNKKEVVISTGGQVSRLWYSSDRGDHWVPRPVPIIQGKNTTGIFSVGIKRNKWIVVGGDYQLDSLAEQHVYYSSSGKSWQAPITPTRGYRSAVEFIFEKTWFALGQGGFDFSIDDGMNWIKGPEEKGLHVVRRTRYGTKIFAAGNGKVSIIEIR